MEKKKQKSGIFDSILEILGWSWEIIGWIEIAASPTMIAAAIGFFIYAFNPNKAGFIIAIIISLAGFSLGAIWATSVHKKQGTIHFMSRVSASPEFDKKEEANKEIIRR